MFEFVSTLRAFNSRYFWGFTFGEKLVDVVDVVQLVNPLDEGVHVDVPGLLQLVAELLERALLLLLLLFL